MEAAGRWLKSIVYCICILELFYHLVQNTYYQKYIRFFGGLVLLMTVIDPVLQFTKNGEFLESNLWKEEVRSQMGEMEQARESLSDLKNQQIEEMMNKELENQIREMAELCDLDVQNIRIEMKEGLQTIDKIEIEQTEKSGQEDRFLEMLQNGYQIPPERIEMKYVEKNQ